MTFYTDLLRFGADCTSIDSRISQETSKNKEFFKQSFALLKNEKLDAVFRFKVSVLISHALDTTPVSEVD